MWYRLLMTELIDPEFPIELLPLVSMFLRCANPDELSPTLAIFGG
ncbi:hypothetical protein A2U01_0063354 [Trifolium medium]|uniref:Uncharacterized protein n=1 Tax=Trifolium medium TaxID=97028 RepID=A0A392S0D9_9FABA|nr:hypothetical protein [Trifolium medium]